MFYEGEDGLILECGKFVECGGVVLWVVGCVGLRFREKCVLEMEIGDICLWLFIEVMSINESVEN